MHQGYLAVDEPALREIRRLFEPLQHGEDLVTAGMSPPAASYSFTQNRFDQTRGRTSGGHEYHAVFLDERQSAVRIHHRA